MVQWVRFHPLSTESIASIPGKGTKIPEDILWIQGEKKIAKFLGKS